MAGHRSRSAGCPRRFNQNARTRGKTSGQGLDPSPESNSQKAQGNLRSKEPVGRTLEFIAQEMFRELNTLGAKANDAAISQRVIACKAELEKIREQAQNLE